MVKRIIIAVIFFSMVLHSASRLGLLSYLYEQRHEIAYAFGLIAEKPIAICSSNYHHNKNLSIETQSDADQTPPPIAAFHAEEIQLFVAAVADLSVDPNRALMETTRHAPVAEAAYATPSLSIFHPPS